jgi:hypothetical protein
MFVIDDIIMALMAAGGAAAAGTAAAGAGTAAGLGAGTAAGLGAGAAGLGGGTAAMFGPAAAGMGAGLLGAAPAAASGMATTAPGMAGLFGPMSAAGLAEAGMSPLAAMGAEAAPATMWDKFGLAAKKMAPNAARGLLSSSQQPQQRRSGAMPRPQQGQPMQPPQMPLTGAQLMRMRMQGMDPWELMMMRARGQ